MPMYVKEGLLRLKIGEERERESDRQTETEIQTQRERIQPVLLAREGHDRN